MYVINALNGKESARGRGELGDGVTACIVFILFKNSILKLMSKVYVLILFSHADHLL